SKAIAVARPYDAKHWNMINDARTLIDLSAAVAEHRKTLAAVEGLIDPQDLAAANLLCCGQVHLPDSARMTEAAAAAGLSTAKGRSEIDDYRALLEMALLVRNGEQLKPASRQAA